MAETTPKVDSESIEAPQKSNLEKAKEKEQAAEEKARAELEEKKQEIYKLLNETLIKISGSVEENFEFYKVVDWCWRADVECVIGKVEGLIDPDIKMLWNLALKLCGATNTCITHILTKALTRMLAESNPIILITATVPRYTILCSVAAGYQIKCLILIGKMISKIVSDYSVNKKKLQLLIKPFIGETAKTEKILDKSKERMLSSLEDLPEKIDELFDTFQIPSTEIPTIPSGEKLSAEDEEALREQFAEMTANLSETQQKFNNVFNTLSLRIPFIKSQINNIFTNIEFDITDHAETVTPVFISGYESQLSTVNESHDKYAKLIGSLFTTAKGGGNPTVELLNGLNDPDLYELSGLLNLSDEDIKKLGPDAAKAVETANKQEASALSSATNSTNTNNNSNAEQVSKPEAPSTTEMNATIAEKTKAAQDAQKQSTEQSEKISKKTVDMLSKTSKNLAEHNNNFNKIVDKSLKSIEDYVTASLETLTIENVYDVLKQIAGEPFVEATQSMMSMEQFFKVILLKIYLRYKNVGNLMKYYYKYVTNLYNDIYKKSDLSFIVEELLPGFESNKSESIIDQMSDLDLVSITGDSIDFTSMIQQFITELPSKIAKLLSTCTSKIVKAITELLGQLLQLLTAIFLPKSVNPNKGLPSASPMSPVTELVEKAAK